MLPHVRESSQVVNERTTNWTAVPCPTAGWAGWCTPSSTRRPRCSACGTRSAMSAGSTSMTRSRPGRSGSTGSKRWPTSSAALRLDALRFQGPGTDLRVGLFASSRWKCARLTTVDGVAHSPNLPTEEVFTTPDPARVEGIVTSTKPLFQSGAVITGLKVRFEAAGRWRSTPTKAQASCAPWRSATTAHSGLAKSRSWTTRAASVGWGRCSTTRCSTRTPPATSRSATGWTLPSTTRATRDHVNSSQLHIDFMIGSDEVSVTGITGSGDEVPLLRGGTWQI